MFSINSVAHLGSRYWTVSRVFSPTDFCCIGGNVFCFVYVGNNTEFLSFCTVKGLTLPFHYILSVSFKTH